MTIEADVYKLVIGNPKVDDGGKYTIDIGGVTSSAYLTVEEADLVFNFTKNLPKKAEGFFGREFDLECTINNPKAPIVWFKGDTKIEVRIVMKTAFILVNLQRFVLVLN
jgi:hypothetical protein